MIFFGSAAVSIPFLGELSRQYPVSLVVTQPDATGGRHCRILETPVKCFAQETGLPCIQPENLSDPHLQEQIRDQTPLIGVVVAYGKWIPRSIHHLPLLHTVNVHFSLLPLFRGAAPVQRAIESGAGKTGLSIFEISARMDGGDIWAQKEVVIEPEETSERLLTRMSILGAPFLNQTLEAIIGGRVAKIPQDETQATLAPALQKCEGMIDWKLPARIIYNHFRAFQPWPGTCFSIPGKVIQATRIIPTSETHQSSPGTILDLKSEGLKIACGDGSVLNLQEIKPPGKKAMRPFDFCLGNCFPHILN